MVLRFKLADGEESYHKEHLSKNDNGKSMSFCKDFDFAIFDKDIDFGERLYEIDSYCSHIDSNSIYIEEASKLYINEIELDEWKRKFPLFKDFMKSLNGNYCMPNTFPSKEAVYINTNFFKSSLSNLLKSIELVSEDDKRLDENSEFFSFMNEISIYSINFLKKYGSRVILERY